MSKRNITSVPTEAFLQQLSLDDTEQGEVRRLVGELGMIVHDKFSQIEAPNRCLVLQAALATLLHACQSAESQILQGRRLPGE